MLYYRMANNEFYKTHDTFFEFLTKNKLNELLHRASTTGELEQTINDEFLNWNIPGYCEVRISHKCDIFLNFIDTMENNSVI